MDFPCFWMHMDIGEDSYGIPPNWEERSFASQSLFIRTICDKGAGYIHICSISSALWMMHENTPLCLIHRFSVPRNSSHLPLVLRHHSFNECSAKGNNIQTWEPRYCINLPLSCSLSPLFGKNFIFGHCAESEDSNAMGKISCLFICVHIYENMVSWL